MLPGAHVAGIAARNVNVSCFRLRRVRCCGRPRPPRIQVFKSQNSGKLPAHALPAPAMTLAELGWNDAFAAEFAAYRERGWRPARLIRDHKIHYAALLEDGEVVDAVLTGKILHDAKSDAELPAVGDWVALELGNEDVATVIHARLKRQTCLSRKSSGRGTEEQVIAANIDLVVVVTDAGSDFNLRRMERYFAIIGR